MTGSDGVDTIDGNDVCRGGDGKDTIDGDDGSDQLDGGAGTDITVGDSTGDTYASGSAEATASTEVVSADMQSVENQQEPTGFAFSEDASASTGACVDANSDGDCDAV
ncbi:MAG: hypothetical protein FJZ00_01415 [Candidatus Sericytochromatia bacterium]|uniref:Calcium-binding protein n=1 Tax=Candidatus Tanganyikabacteria bacterium TaxID=2961651 RepID=A0A938BHV6_9BACT|nr:hypothetical protein [Candidatus Tanganyikabacteria bacterium]